MRIKIDWQHDGEPHDHGSKRVWTTLVCPAVMAKWRGVDPEELTMGWCRGGRSNSGGVCVEGKDRDG